jgi:hypothetical protein
MTSATAARDLHPLRGEGRGLQVEFSNPQPNPQNAMSYTTSANFGSPRGSVKSLKTLFTQRCHGSVLFVRISAYCRTQGFSGFAAL